jgi:hypothetical protein
MAPSDQNGYATIPRSLLHDPDVPSDAKLVYLILSSHVGTKDSAWPSHATMAKLIGISKSTVKRQVAWLADNGHIQVIQRKAPDGIVNLSNEYKLVAGSKREPSKKVGSDGTHWVQAEPSGASSDPGGGVTANRGVGSERATNEPHTTNLKTSTAAGAAEVIREDILRVCDHLADRIASNDEDGKRPNIGKGWHDAARLMIDRDGRTEEKIHVAIDWCQDDDFWRSVVLSMPKLRKQYAQLQLKAKAQREKPQPGQPTAKRFDREMSPWG